MKIYAFKSKKTDNFAYIEITHSGRDFDTETLYILSNDGMSDSIFTTISESTMRTILNKPAYHNDNMYINNIHFMEWEVVEFNSN